MARASADAPTEVAPAPAWPQPPPSEPAPPQPAAPAPPAGPRRRVRRLALIAGLLLLIGGGAAAALYETDVIGGSSGKSGGAVVSSLPSASLPPPPAASGDCSSAEATAVVERLRLSDPSVADPVYKVLCGAFTGQGSQTMVASIFGPGNSGMTDWAAFRWAGGAWQLLVNRHQAAVLTAAGSDIGETVSVFRAGDPRCCPSGGTRMRSWHWDGTSLAAGPWTQGEPAAQPARAAASGYFKTPTGNIVCFHSPGPTDLPQGFISCGIKSGLKPAPPHRPCQEGDYAGDRVGLLETGRVEVPSCAGDPGPFIGSEQGARVLRYGTTWSGGGLSCTSAFRGLTCRNESGHGFFLSRQHWRSF